MAMDTPAAGRQKFKLWHSLLGTAALLAVEWALMQAGASTAAWIVIIAAMIGTLANLYVATEVIEEVRNKQHMLVLLSAVMLQFLVFYAFQYAFLGMALPGSFPTLGSDAVSFALHSLMVFVFNPLNLPVNGFGRGLLLVNTLGAVVLVLFILQNIWQFRSKAQ